jgi:DNA-binding MarR family transcriptional regulator
MQNSSQASQVASRLRLAVARTARRLRQEAGGGLSPTLSAALATIDRHGPLTPSELADRERVKRPTATRLLATLEEGGLVARTSDPSDRRSSLIAITPEGRELMRTLRTRKDAYLVRRLAKLTADERATLAQAADLLERMLEEDDA